MPTTPVIGIRQLVPVLVVDAIFLVAIVAVLMSGIGSRPYIGELTVLHTLLVAFALTSLAVLHWTVIRPIRRAQQARRAAAGQPEPDFVASLEEKRTWTDDR